MQIQRSPYATSVKFCKEIVRIREKFLLPGESCPAETLTELIEPLDDTVLRRSYDCRLFAPCLMPVHIYNHHIHRYVIRLEMVCETYQFIIRIFPKTAPPVAESILRREWNLAGNLCKICKGCCVIMAVSEEIHILTHSFRTTLSPVFPVPFHLCEYMTSAFIYDSPSVTGQHTFIIRFAGLEAVTSVKGAGGGKQIARLIHSRSPGNLLHTFL